MSYIACITCLLTLALSLACAQGQSTRPAALIIDHHNTDMTKISVSDIQRARDSLHIAYGHTSHGSQLTSGMRGLVAFANAGGKGLELPKDAFEFGRGPGDRLDLDDGTLGGDCGYFPDWINHTRKYLADAKNARCNVILWSWCGQVGVKFGSGKLTSEYLDPMSKLEAEFPRVTFVYMTGHLDRGNEANTKNGNKSIREFCRKNGKVLFDFADIESHDPDGKFYEFANDNCDYFQDIYSRTKLGNWADEWQASHREGVDWFNCPSAHSKPLNANLKAYAAWALFVEIARRK